MTFGVASSDPGPSVTSRPGISSSVTWKQGTSFLHQKSSTKAPGCCSMFRLTSRPSVHSLELTWFRGWDGPKFGRPCSSKNRAGAQLHVPRSFAVKHQRCVTHSCAVDRIAPRPGAPAISLAIQRGMDESQLHLPPTAPRAGRAPRRGTGIGSWTSCGGVWFALANGKRSGRALDSGWGPQA